MRKVLEKKLEALTDSKPFKVTLRFVKNVNGQTVETTREETMWAASNAEIRRSVQRRHGFEVMVGNIQPMQWDVAADVEIND